MCEYVQPPIYVPAEWQLYSVDTHAVNAILLGMSAKHDALDRLGDNLRKAREGKGWSQERLALKSGLHRTYVGAVERGEYNITILTLRRLTKTLGITLRDALEGVS